MCAIAGWLSSIPTLAQTLVVDEYTALDGLPSNLVKQVHQDSRGYIWIATDGGLVRFDGTTFSTLGVADGLPSTFVKAVFSDSHDRLYVVTDMGIVEVERSQGSTRILPVIRGASEPTDSLLFYPKGLYEARDGALWISDGRGVMRLSAEGRERYVLPGDSWPESFVRSYSIFEDDHGHLIAISQRGQVFIHHPGDSVFSELQVPERMSATNVALRGPDGRIFICGSGGVRSFVIAKDHRIEDWTVVSTHRDVMDLVVTEDGLLLLGTAGNGLQSLSIVDGNRRSRRFVSLSSSVVHDIMIDSEGDLFLSTDNGFSHVRRPFFERAVRFKSTAIESIAISPDGKIFGIEANSFFAIEERQNGVDRISVFSSTEGLTAVATDGLTHWVGSSKGNVQAYRRGNLTTFRLRGPGTIGSMAIDGSSNVWTTRHKIREIVRISSDGEIRYFGPDRGITAPVSVVRYVEGSIYVGAEGDSYLFRYNPATDSFDDISQPLSIDASDYLIVNDIHVAPDGRIWLASNHGLLVQGSGAVTTFSDDLSMSEYEVRAIAQDRFGYTWVGTGRGLYRIAGDQISLFRTDSGIANLTVNYRSIVIDDEGRPWVGHYGGISRWNRMPGEALVTARPEIVAFSVNGQLVDAGGEDVQAPYGSHTEGDFVSLSYPGESVRYQYRVDGHDDVWSVPSPDAHVHLPELPSGNFVLEVRAQQEGRLWSAPAAIRLMVDIPWYRKWWVLALFVVASAVAFFVLWEVHDHIRTLQLRNRNERLERLVTKRTKELSDQKWTIEQTNRELKEMIERNHEFLGIAAHDLRNPLTSLIGFSELLIDSVDDMSPVDFLEKSGEILPIIHRAASTMQGVIQDLLDSQLLEREDRTLKLEETDLSQLTRSVINLNSVASRRKGITLTFHPKESFKARVDARSMQRVIDNLVSNAVKYSPPGSEVKVMLSRTGGAIRISVIDRGPGLTEEDKSRVFGKLQRLSAKPTGGEPSTGLGLYVAKGVTEMHGGRIGVNSVPGEGSEFWVEIPSSVMRAAA